MGKRVCVGTSLRKVCASRSQRGASDWQNAQEFRQTLIIQRCDDASTAVRLLSMITAMATRSSAPDWFLNYVVLY